MPPQGRTADEEAAFMASLLDDSSFQNGPPSPELPKQSPFLPSELQTPTKKPAKSPKQSTAKSIRSKRSPTKIKGEVGDDFDATAFLDGAEDWDMDSFDLTPVKPKSEKILPDVQKSDWKRETCTRCSVESIVQDGFRQKVLTVRLPKSEERRTVILQDDWIDTDVRVRDTINVIGSFSSSSSPSSSQALQSITVTSKENLLVLHPDILLTPSTLSSAPQCTRKPLLSALIRSSPSSSSDSSSMVWGNMLHEVMQCLLRSGDWSESSLDSEIDRVVRKGLTDLVRLNIPTVDAGISEVKKRAIGLINFADKYLSTFPKSNAVLSNTRDTNSSISTLAITSLFDVEEDIWSPTYGLKGKLDATVQTLISSVTSPSNLSTRNLNPNPNLEEGPKPLEIKTGRAMAASEHRAQTMLYTLLLSERYNVPVESGLLYYTQSEEVVLVPRGRNEVRGLIGVRNRVASYMVRRWTSSFWDRDDAQPVEEMGEEFLSPPIDDERVCKRCYAQDACMLYRKAVEELPAPDASYVPSLAEIYDIKTSHLTSSQTAFFKTWEKLLSHEESDLVRFKKELWTMGAKDREARGRCFSGMVMDANYDGSSKTGGQKIHSFTYRFVRARGWDVPTSGKEVSSSSLLNGQLNVNDPITVSVEPNLLALARGFILELTPTDVILGVDHALDESLFKTRIASSSTSSVTPEGRVVFRIDKDELSTGMARIRDNVAHMFYAHGDRKRLELVVDLRKPEFEALPETAEQALPKSLQRHTNALNPSQTAAVSHVLRANDYALVLGMPGTGKTTVIAALIRCLVEQGKTVLLTSYTHSAVDNVLLKFASDEKLEFGILRLGNNDKIHPRTRKFALGARKDAQTIEQLEMQLMSPPVVATTCLSVDHALFSRRQFDYCIVDEASQITLPTCLGPLRYADRFVLVGDHFQLPPLVKSAAARKGGLDVSLFRRLSDAHPHSVVDLAYQYRMNEEIMELSNKLIYSDRLRCGTQEIAKRSLQLPNQSFMKDLHGAPSTCKKDGACWLEKLCSKECKAVFVDTDLLPAPDSKVGDLVQNEVEAELVYQLTETLLRSGISEDQIGIISLYRQQIKLLGHRLQVRKGIEILTADRSQGRDKDCVIISMVRSNGEGQIGDLVRDWRRMNVSFTRARAKLVIFGSRKTLQSEPLLSEFFSLMESRDWILALPPRAHQMHADEFSSQSKRAAPQSGKPPSSAKKENHRYESPRKKAKVGGTKTITGEEGMWKKRHILVDLMNEHK